MLGEFGLQLGNDRLDGAGTRTSRPFPGEQGRLLEPGQRLGPTPTRIPQRPENSTRTGNYDRTLRGEAPIRRRALRTEPSGPSSEAASTTRREECGAVSPQARVDRDLE